MVQRLPDEYFRKRAAESQDVGVDAPSEPAVERPAPRRAPTTPARAGVAPSLVVVPLVLAVIVGFLIGRLLPAPLGPPGPQASPTALTPAPSHDVVVPYDGPADTVPALRAMGDCRDGQTWGAPATLLDGDPSTVWRCRGDGIGEVIDFTFERPVGLVGIRLVNGNTAVADRYLKERRITAIRWTFADGSYFDQGFAPSESSPQEVRFPETMTATARMEILATTPGENKDQLSDSVAISALEFLTAS
ncbi:MAG: hypothetical protein QM713_06645 [Arachnia sp.]